MRIADSKISMSIGGFILASLILITYNVLNLMPLLDPELPGPSSVVKLAKSKWLQLSEKSSRSIEKAAEDIDLDLIVAKFAPEILAQKIGILSTTTTSTTIPGDNAPEIKLPKLTGIFQTTDIHGNICSYASIEGKIIAEHDKVQGFTVEKISDKGIILGREGITKFIPVSEVDFTIYRKEDRTTKVSKETIPLTAPVDVKEYLKNPAEFIESNIKEPSKKESK